MYELLSPYRIGKLAVKNRVVLPSMCLYYSDGDGNITDKMFTFFERRAKTGVGAFIIGANPHGKNKNARPSLNDDLKIPNWKRIIGMFHTYGAAAICQLHPSGIQIGRKEFKHSPLDLSTEEVRQLVERYAEGAHRAQKAGFDGVEIHGAHGHEVAVFLSAALNKRTDRYGAGKEGRAAIITEMIALIKEKCGIDFPVILRISGEERIPGGRGLDETIDICALAKKAGADAFHVSVGMPESEEWECAPGEVEQGHLAWMGKELKNRLGLPVITVGRIVDWEIAERIVRDGESDFVAVGRGLLAESDWMASIGTDEKNAYRRCIGCNQGCRTRREVEKTFTRCFQNPILGREEEIRIPVDREKKKVCVVGAGLSGLESARVLSLRGHEVAVFEQSDRIGGLFNEAAMAPGKSDYLNLLRFYEHTLKKQGVAVRLGVPVDRFPTGFDAVVVATGGIPIRPRIFADGTETILAVDLFHQASLQKKTHVVVGNGVVGYETADFLAARGREAIIVGDSLAEETETIGIARWRFMLNRFSEGKVRILKGALVKSAHSDHFVYILNGKEERVDGDFVYTVACGFKADTRLYDALRAERSGVYIVGTAKEMFDGMSALHDAFNTALAIKLE